jgi:RHS repeat-associated protein
MPTTASPSTVSASSNETHRGFTGHEMLDAVGLVHMGGRIYDPITARFLSPDPFVQSPDNLQNLNRYSYVLNNPLSFTDPSGFFFKSIGKFFKKHWKTIAAVGIGLVTGWGGYLIGASLGSGTAIGATLGGIIGTGVGGGFGSTLSGTLLAGGSVGDALRAGLSGGISGGIQAAASFGFSNLSVVGRSIANGIVGGAVEQVRGGQFRHGFYAAAFTSGSEPQVNEIAGFQGAAFGRIAARAVVGGTASVLGGGKFANGAVSGGFGCLFIEGAISYGETMSKTAQYPSHAEQGCGGQVTSGVCVVGDDVHAFESEMTRLKSNMGTADFIRDIERRGDITVTLFDESNGYGGDGKVWWNPSFASQTSNGGRLSPALILYHELRHASMPSSIRTSLQSIQAVDYDNFEEWRVIRRYEAPAARQLGDGVRHDHR